MAAMKEELCRLEITRPGEDHGCPKNGGYSIFAMQRSLEQKGYRLVHLNRVSLLRGMSKREWASRLVASSFTRLVIIGKPAGQVADIYHCIASTVFGGKRMIIDPDEGQREQLTESSLHAFLPILSSVYAIVTHAEHAKYLKMFRRSNERARCNVERAHTKPAKTRRQRRRDQYAIQKAAIGVESKRAPAIRGLRRKAY